MSACPQCHRNFGDREFRICPVDGANLVDEPTQLIDPMLGRVFDGRFRLIKLIGRGGMGAVYKALHIQMDRVCAIKLLSPVSSDIDAAVARFRREARMTSRIDSPNAITIYDFGETETGLLYLAMEYIDGVTLAEVLDGHVTLPIERVVSIATQTANALVAAHSLGIVHRDLKPSNIMLINKDGLEVVKVLDFGIAKSVIDTSDDLTQTGFLLGTPTYMSPEQVLGEAVNSRTDVYSLALIVYEMLAGRLPFEGDNLRSLMMSRVTGEPKPLRAIAPSIDEAVEKVVMSGLSRYEEFRMPDVQTFARSLSAAVSGKAPPTPAASDNGSSITVLQPQVSSEETVIGVVSTPEQSAQESPANAKPKPKKYLLVFLILSLVVFVMGLAGLGTFLYTRDPKTNSPDAATNPTVQTTQSGLGQESDNNRTADANYQRGRILQQEAQRLSDVGSLKAADEKNLEATVEYRKALEQRPNFPEAHENLGVALYNLGRAADAITEYELAVAQTQRPGASLFTNYGMALLVSSRFREAANAFSRAIEYQPNDVDLYYYKGFALHFAEDNEGSRSAFVQYLRVAPTGQHAKEVREILDGRVKPTLKGGSRL
jgi:serine/threonine protein kinase